MAVMRKEQRDIAELGPIGIVREALKLYAANVKVYLSIQLALFLPLAIVLLVADYFIFAQYSPLPLHSMNGKSASPKAPRFLGSVSAFNGGLSNPELWNQIEVLLISTVFSLVFQAAAALPRATSLYTVGLHYAGQPISFIDAVRAVTPGLWMRLTLTTLYVAVITYSISLVQILGILLLPEFHNVVVWQLVWAIVVPVLSLVLSFGLSIILFISSGVSVLGEDYGWAAMKKGLKLLKEKVKVAIFFQVLWTVPGFIGTGVSVALLFQLNKYEFHVSNVALLSFTVLVLLAWMTLFWEIGTLCAGVQYVSFKAYHDESLSDSFYQKRTVLVDGYESLGDESRAAMLQGNAV